VRTTQLEEVQVDTLVLGAGIYIGGGVVVLLVLILILILIFR
jgi:hypothetical protein